MLLEKIYKSLPFFLGGLGLLFGLSCYFIVTCFEDAGHFTWWLIFLTVQTATGIAIGQLLKRLHISTNTDDLTRLANRTCFYRYLQKKLQRSNLSALSLLLIDIDNFKQVNDTRGHLAGDNLLRKLALILQAHVPKGSLIARIGGDEFGIILSDTDLSEAQKLAEVIRCAAERELKDHHVTLSIGVTHHVDCDQPDKLISQADTALYSAKENKNSVSL